MRVILRQFKHSRFPHTVEMQGDADPTQCLVTALKAFIALRGRAPGPLFITLAGHPYSANTARVDFQTVLTFCRLDTGSYNSVSFRIGAASNAAARGFSDAQIRLLGRWRSTHYAVTYARVLVWVAPPSRIMPDPRRLVPLSPLQSNI